MATSRVALGLTGLAADIIASQDTCAVAAHLFWDSTASTWRIVSTANPLPVTGGSGGGGGSGGIVTQGAQDATATAWKQVLYLGSSLVSAGNPLPVTSVLTGTLPAFGSAPLVNNGLGGAAVSASNPLYFVFGTGATLPALVAGSSVIGKVGIDQTTPGTTNLVQVSNTDFGPEGQKRSYRDSVLITPPTTQGVIYQMQGSSSSTIRIRTVRIKGAAAATAAVLSFVLAKYSTAVSGGTGVSITHAKMDSTSAASGATSQYYSTMGTAGTLTSQLDADPYYVGVGANTQPEYVVNFGQDGTQACVLRGTSEYFAISNGTAAFSANTNLSINVTWTEE